MTTPCHICGGVPSSEICSRCPPTCKMVDGVCARDASEARFGSVAWALRAARVQGMTEGYAMVHSPWSDFAAAIEAVRKGER